MELLLSSNGNGKLALRVKALLIAILPILTMVFDIGITEKETQDYIEVIVVGIAVITYIVGETRRRILKNNDLGKYQ